MAPTAAVFRLAPPQRAARAWPVLALAAVVVGGHAWLAALLAPAPPRAGLPRAAAVQLRSLPRAVPAVAPPSALPDGRPDTRSAGPNRPPSSVQAPPAPVPAAPRRPAGTHTPTAAASPAAAPAPVVPAVATDAAFAAPAAGTGAAAVPAESAEGQPPPLYATLLPAPVQLRYALQYNGRPGEALLAWQHDGLAYRLTLDGTGAGGQPLVVQASQGLLDSHGLAPERFTDRRAAGRLRAANFRRDTGRIAYSGPPHTHPAWPGAQDRLSWVAQLAAVLAAADAPPPELQLFVADALGNAGLWQLQRLPDAPGPSPWGALAQQHWQRTPPRPEGLQVDVWLAAAPGTPSGTWPLRLRFAVPRSGDVFELTLLAVP